MINFIDNWKCYIFLAGIIFLGSLNLLQRYQNTRLSHVNEVCNNNLLAIKAGSDYRQEQIKLAEQEARQEQAESLKRADEILNSDAGNTCEDAIALMVDKKAV